MPCSPEDAVPDSFVPLVVVLPVEVGGHAGVEPPAGAVVGAAVSGGVHVVVTVGRGEELLVVVEVLVETDGVPSGPTTVTHRYISDVGVLDEYLMTRACTEYIYVYIFLPVSADGQAVA